MLWVSKVHNREIRSYLQVLKHTLVLVSHISLYPSNLLLFKVSVYGSYLSSIVNQHFSPPFGRFFPKIEQANPSSERSRSAKEKTLPLGAVKVAMRFLSGWKFRAYECCNQLINSKLYILSLLISFIYIFFTVYIHVCNEYYEYVFIIYKICFVYIYIFIY